ncbi:choice-of-anchor D domain-containing protein [Granulicella tundricola]|uniref:choice-of-anchor D domain-containing protein n=1 Tax=Granulicella tundricola TaxID=940615 RepID=UPI0003195D75|nr:choice-of-anchor D domain-containing protein [Granulicella tundricola]
MKNSFRFARLLAAFCLGVFSLVPAFGQSGLLISQIYGGGGNSGASFNADFIELYNPTSAAISTSGLSVQYASAAGNFTQSLTLASASIPSHTYFLVQTTASGTTGAALPTPDTTGIAPNLSATAGKVALVNGTTALSTDTTCALIQADTQILDFVGYGTTASCFKGSGPAPTTANNATSIVRKVAGTNTNDNAADFTTSSPITPHNSGGGVVVPPTVPVVTIHDIQGVKSTTAMTVSPYAGQRVTTSGVVTTLLSNAFFMQSSDATADSNPLTPEGIEVFTSTKPTVLIGNAVTVTGTVQTYPAVTASKTPATEITSPTIVVTAPAVALPTPIILTTSMLTAGGGLYQLTPYEGMRVSVPSMTTISGTNGSITDANEPAEIATSVGYFYAVITGTARPFREPGVDIRDPAVPGLPAGVAKFDDNPERILVDSTIAGGTSLEIPTGAIMANVTGVLDFTFSSDSFYDPSRLILDATYPRTSVTGGMTVQAVTLPASNEFTVASFNIERFYNTSSADDLYYVPAGVNGYNGSSGTAIVSTGQTFISEAADNTPAAYARRLTKLSLAIRTVLNSPDVVTIEEVENQSVANDIAAQINSDAGVTNLYTAFSTDNKTYYTQDGTGISVGFLIKNTVDNLGVTQYGAGETFTPTSGSLTTLNDRPWLVLSAGIKRAAGVKDYPITVVVNHMKALTGQSSATTNSTRLKKELQAEDIAKFIQTQQAAGKHVISGGDFNAFEFSDGYNDTLGTYTNTNVLPATQVLQPGVAGLVTPPLTDLALTIPAAQRWSYVEDGSAQILDHMVVTPELVAAGAHFAYGHLNADFPLTAYNDATTAARNSDHDPAIGYFILPAPVLSATVTPNPATAFAGTTIGATSAGQVFTFTNTGEGPITVTGVTTTGDFAVTSACTAPVAISSTCTANVVFRPTAAGTRTGSVTFATNVSGSTYIVALTGVGINPPDFSVGDASGNATTSVTVVAGNTGTVPLTFTPLFGFSGTVSITCVSTATVAPTGVSCTAPAAFTLTGASTQNITFTTASRLFSRNGGLGFAPDASPLTKVLVLAAAGLLMLLAATSRKLGRAARLGGLLSILTAICFATSGCGGSSGPTVNPNGTPAGTYTYTVTVTSGTVVHKETINLIVQ